MSKAELGRAPGVGKDTLRNWERTVSGERDSGATIKKLDAVSRALGVPLAVLIGEDQSGFQEQAQTFAPPQNTLASNMASKQIALAPPAARAMHEQVFSADDGLVISVAGNRVVISASVDRKGLAKLKEKITHIEALLED